MGNATDPAECAEKVFLVDDDRSILSAYTRLLRTAGYEVEAFESSREFLAKHDPAIPGCAVLDIRMNEMDGLALQEQLSADGSPRPIIFITGCDDVRTGVKALKAGAADYLTKPVDGRDLIAAVESAMATDRKNRTHRAELETIQRRYDRLSARERQVMWEVVRGRLNKQIANDLGIVEKTAKVHRARVMEKMQVRSVAALVHLIEHFHLAEVYGRAVAPQK
jgi:FixJ family two-component response regulator